MAKNISPQRVIDSYRKRQKMLPFIITGLAVVLIAVGLIILIVWLTGPGGFSISLFATATPTPTQTATPTPITPSPTATLTPTETSIPTETLTPTPSGPFEYTVKENDHCWGIAQTYGVDIDVLLAINGFTDCPIRPGDKILVPAPGQQMPTETPMPEDLARGTLLEYTVKLGESMQTIAAKFSSTVEQILKATNAYNRKNNLPLLEDQNKIFAGQKLIVPVNIATAVPTLVPTSTPAATKIPATATATPKP